MEKTLVPAGSLPNNRGFIGGLYIRPFGPFNEGRSEQGHEHYIDHATFVLSGAVRIETDNGVWEVEAPNFMHVPKDVRHKLTAVKDGRRHWLLSPAIVGLEGRTVTGNETGPCTFYKNGLCEVHDRKPIEGRLSMHDNDWRTATLAALETW